jgi:hypothetical protein
MRIGVSGHANITPATAELVYRALRDLLAAYRDVTGVTCIARGADQVFARAMMAAVTKPIVSGWPNAADRCSACSH